MQAEITREEAAEWLTTWATPPDTGITIDVSGTDYAEALRTVVALSDENHRLLLERNDLGFEGIVMRECIDRLWDGWLPAIPNLHFGWRWTHAAEPTEPMTPEQQAVMAR